MVETASEFRRAVAARNREVGGQRRRFGADLRARAVELAGAARRSGQTWEQIASELGVRATQLQKWSRESAPPAFVRVEVAEEATVEGMGGGLRVVTPEGYVIDGLDVASATELVRRLR